MNIQLTFHDSFHILAREHSESRYRSNLEYLPKDNNG